MPGLFSALPPISYNGRNLRNILFRPKIIDNLQLISPNNFYPYVIKEEETIEQVAYYYYGSTDYIWLILLCNDMIDPYYEWYMSAKPFEDYITSKYGSVAAARSLIVHKKDADGNLFSPDTTVALISGSSAPNSSIPVLTSVDAYTYEIEENEKRKHIILIDRSFLPQIDRELRNLYNA